MSCVLRRGHFVLVFHETAYPASIKLDHEEIQVHRRAVKTPLPVAQADLLVAPAGSFRCYLIHNVDFILVMVSLTAAASISHPIKRRLSVMETIAVEPPPTNGSHTSWPGLVNLETKSTMPLSL